MSTRDAIGQSRVLLLALIAGMAWTGFTVVRVLGQIDYWNPTDVGHTAAAGVVGLGVLIALLLFSLSLFSGLGHDEPAPETWPPEDAS